MNDREVSGSMEDRLIQRYFAPLAQHAGAFGLADDAAVMTPPAGCDLVLKADGIIGGVHFFADDPADTVASKALRVNLSDLAAKGAQPLGFLLTLALPKGIDEAWLSAFAQGLAADASRYGCPLYGGDTDHTPGPIVISIAAFGAIARGKMVRRVGARPGDRVMLTGTVGDAALGLLLRRDRRHADSWRLAPRHQEELVRRYLLPEPRTAISDLLRAHASAAMDVSDGLAGDLGKLCRASRVAAEIEVAQVPLSQAARAALASEPGLIEAVLTGGDDYEVLAAIPPDEVEVFAHRAATAGVAVTEIGTFRSGSGETRFIDADGKALVFSQPSFSHF